jgi:GTP cyclohydrolase II
VAVKHLTHLQIKELLDENRDHDCTGVGEDHICVRIAAIAELPTRFGDFHIVAFYNKRDDKEHAAIVRGDPTNSEDVVVRLHSECLTGDALGSLRCDCRDQLQTSLRALAAMECGVLLYLRQEGRGIGLTNKIRAYGLQDYGYDTVEANLALGFPDDRREYSTAAHMLHSLKVKSVRIMTNNPRKIQGLTDNGIEITGRIPLVIPPNPYNEFYLHTKATKSGHLIEFGDHERLQEQMDMPLVQGMTEMQVDALEQVQE